ncbi:helix-turn-helix transcriptional regulator [Saccharospirillum sp. MSK14-1]|uniref:ArsR/SmtB family transcription factor n=1 Tax=Saccharospirillum sp. MSK14-1 TaxID=1897632 RepID=UPI000D3D1957|nr:metalloregulator ArsR/SmtB family transcription factor [Saccharospirillum sp. MSK14-1]
MEALKESKSLAIMEEQAGQAAKLLKALSNERRLLILCNLVGGELSVTQLNERILLSQSALSQHLARLRQDGLVAIRKEAQTVYYRIASDEAQQVLGLLYSLYCPD